VAAVALLSNFPISTNSVKNSLLLVGGSYLATAFTLPLIARYQLVDRKYYILPVIFSVYLVALFLVLILRFDYSLSLIFIGAFFSFFWLFFTAFARANQKRLTLHLIDNFSFTEFVGHKNLDITILNEPYDQTVIKHGLVVDLHENITPYQEKFIADCSLNNIPVFHAESIKEMVNGKVQVRHLSENSIGTLQPNPVYQIFKRIWESLIIILSMPITLTIMVVTAILIRLESAGPVFFTQERVGQSGRVFKIYKFRSMTVDKSCDKDKFATDEQARITKVGKFIRKVRIDELPQFFNVLKGDMSLIGPRPEQESFVKLFEQEIPFYGYRHMVKPGITGWAQTVHGYADDTDSTKEKLAYDLYYIKHLSFWLDVNIVFKTLKTMLTGFGAK
tara:strand:- start:1709 stop:2878 length:1170 start_codon:yes stop_codon:yes gene_type:complete